MNQQLAGVGAATYRVEARRIAEVSRVMPDRLAARRVH
jgi:hypothetical protein